MPFFFLMKMRENQTKLNSDSVFKPRKACYSRVWQHGFSATRLPSTSFQPFQPLSGRHSFLNDISASFTRIVHSQGVVFRQHTYTPPTHDCTQTHTHTLQLKLYEVTDIKQREWHMLYAHRADLNCIWTCVSEESHHWVHKAWTVCTQPLVLESRPLEGLGFHEKWWKIQKSAC